MTGTTDLLLAMAHHLLAFGLAAVLAAEIALTAPGLSGRRLRLLQRLDRHYGAVAMLLIAIGVLRVIYGGKGPDFYIASHAFWAKMAAFVGVALLSIAPTRRIVGWTRQAKNNRDFAVAAEETRPLRKYYAAQVALFATIPVFAAMMARGL